MRTKLDARQTILGTKVERRKHERQGTFKQRVIELERAEIKAKLKKALAKHAKKSSYSLFVGSAPLKDSNGSEIIDYYKKPNHTKQLYMKYVDLELEFKVVGHHKPERKENLVAKVLQNIKHFWQNKTCAMKYKRTRCKQ